MVSSFRNEHPSPDGRTRWDLVKWIMLRKSQTWQVDSEQETTKFFAAIKPKLPENRPDADMDDWKVWFVGHATALIQIGPYNFLTDSHGLTMSAQDKGWDPNGCVLLASP